MSALSVAQTTTPTAEVDVAPEFQLTADIDAVHWLDVIEQEHRDRLRDARSAEAI